MLVEQESLSIQTDPNFRSRSYISPFDRIDYSTTERYQPYSGTLGEVLNELEHALSKPSNPHNRALAIFHPPRIIRAAVNHKISNPTSPKAHEGIHAAIKLGLHLYRNPENSLAQLLDYKKNISTTTANDLLTTPLHQKKDRPSWEAAQPDKSKHTAEQLAKSHQDILFIALAHGAIAPGMDTYLRFGELKQTNSVFYPVRFSNNSSLDKLPQISDVEKRFLREHAEGRDVVVFDDDRTTGATLDAAEDTFRSELRKPVTTITNIFVNTVYFSD